MAKTMILVENLSKVYRMGTIGSGSLRDDLTIWWANLRGKENPLLRVGESAERIEGEYLWALRDINLKVKEGEILGIIGSNGAGKSTLLKILSRITSPSEGEFHLGGRLSSLIEVGTGFHSELTGRENIYLNGAIHGMSRSEIDRRLDEIIDFAGVGEYIDTPVKRYSSGMYVRLGFAVAAHLNSEILLVDEVLSVGDAEFQKKCLGKLGDVAHEGRTVLFVSHNLQAIRQLCDQTLWINSGQVKERNDTKIIIDKYLRASYASVTSASKTRIEEIISKLPQDPVFKLDSVRLLQHGQPVSNIVFNGENLDIEIEYKLFKESIAFRVYFDLLDEEFNYVLQSFHDNAEDGVPTTAIGVYFSQVSIPKNLLAPRNYQISINACIYMVKNFLPFNSVVIPITVIQSGNYNQGYTTDIIRGKIAPILPWKTVKKN